MDDKYIIKSTWTQQDLEDLTEYPTELEIQGTVYELNKANAYKLVDLYLDQKIVFNGELKEYIWWWFVRTYKEHPEIYKSNNTYGGTTASTIHSYTAVTKEFRTQKAKGVHYINSNNGGLKTLPFDVINGGEQDDKIIEGFLKKFTKVFLRPCPVTPRHGFVESKLVTSKEEIKEVYEQVKKVDKDGEAILMKPIEAEYNFVITPANITIGKGHDGATAGHETKTYPLTGKWQNHFKKVENAGIKAPDVPYIEAVSASESSYIVQMRGGPQPVRSQDYIPEDVHVTKVIEAKGDLLDWESLMRSHKGVKGVVVTHVGGSLTTHYGVHAMLNEIPCVTSKEVKVGDKLEKSSEDIRHSMSQFMNGLLRSLVTPYKKTSESSVKRRVTSMIYATQYYSMFDKERTWYVGHAVGTMLNLGIAACGGEWRHHKNSPYHGKYARQAVYSRLTKDFMRARGKHHVFAESFLYDEWGSSYGGPKWYDCADAIIQLDKEVLRFVKTPTKEVFADIMMAMNRAINCAHNGGWWFNKYIDTSVFNNINNEHIGTIVDAVRFMYENPITKMTPKGKILLGKLKEAKPIHVAKKFDIINTPIKITKAQVRLLQDNPQVKSKDDIVSTSVRVQYQTENAGTQENDFEAVVDLKEVWDCTVEYKKSYVSGLIAYVPAKVKKLDDKNWGIYLKDVLVTKVPVSFKTERVKVQEEEQTEKTA